MTAVLRAEGLTRVFGTGDTAVHALTGVDLQLDEGELVVLRGASGSGKTTLLNLLGGLDAPTSGRVLLGDTDLTAATEAERIEARRRRFGFVFQSFALIPTLTAAENVELPLRLIGAPVPERTARVARLLDQVGLAGAEAQRPAELSGGQQQRVGFARALATSPSILLADEPTGQLDSATGERLMDLLGSLVHDTGVTALVATHDPRLVDRADRVLALRDGALAAGGRHAAPGASG